MNGWIFRFETQCAGKVSHRKKSQALAQVRNMARRGKLGVGGLQVYSCPHCGRFHVGRRPGLNHDLMTGGRR